MIAKLENRRSWITLFREEIEYKELQPNSDLQKRKEYWEIAKGLQKTDGLATSPYLEKIIKETVEGKYDTETANKKIKEYYANVAPGSPEYESKEADKVAGRITMVLENSAFKFSPITLKTIHRELFQGVLDESWVGDWRKVNISKGESVLDGKSVIYGQWSDILEQLKYDFDEEANNRYVLPFTSAQIKSFAKFTSAIWQTYPFREGNTRTIATFLIMYLRNMGVPANNDYFKEYSEYFRDALVRSNYSELSKGIHPDFSYLEMFFENVLLEINHDLHLQDLRCTELF